MSETHLINRVLSFIFLADIKKRLEVFLKHFWPDRGKSFIYLVFSKNKHQKFSA